MLTEKQVQDFQRIYKITFGRDISRKQAFDEGSRLVHSIETVYEPVTKKALKQHEITKSKEN